MHSWKEHILSSIAGLFTIAQFVLIFFYSVDGLLLLRYIGFVIWVLSVVFGWLPMYIFKKSGAVEKVKSYIHTSKLVDSGLYGIVRHPQYLAGPLFNIAMMLLSQHWLVILVGIPPVILMAIDIRHADQEGLQKFGDEYRAYIQKVPKINFVAGTVRWWQRNKNIKTGDM